MFAHKVVIVGQGYVGVVTGACMAEKGYSVVGVDCDPNKIALLNKGISPIYEPGLDDLIQKNIMNRRLRFVENCDEACKTADFIFICVGTPEQASGEVDLQYIDACAYQIAHSVENDCIVVIKSTVPVGTNDRVENIIRRNLKCDVKVDVVSNPEFLSQGSAVKDMMCANRIVIGTENDDVARKMEIFYQSFDCPIVSVDRCSAELIKYASNNYLALKISYINDIANLCELTGTDIHDVVRGMAYDERIGSRFLNAGIGFGGSCFEKDAKALCYSAAQLGYRLQTVETALSINQKQKIHLLEKASQLLNLYDLKISVLGVTFKPNTDDIRKAPSLDNFPLLLENRNHIVVFDPAGMENFKKIYPAGGCNKGTVDYADSAYDALNDADICFIFTEWDEFKKLTPQDFVKRMKRPLVFDGRNIFSKAEMLKNGVDYHSVGR